MPTPSKKFLWTGRVISALIVFTFGMSGIMKFMGGEQLEEGLTHLGLPMSIVTSLAVLELACTVLYLFPSTAVLGAILLTGYLGGAICTHWRVGDPFITHIVLGILIWLGIYLREPRLWDLIPWRNPPAA